MDGFAKFISERNADLRRIARSTRGEHSIDDVTNEVWIVAVELASRITSNADFGDPAFQSLLLSHLYQRLVRYTELTVRNGIRLDHPLRGSDSDHPLLNSLSDTADDPLQTVIAAQDAVLQPALACAPFSIAVAYVTLLRRFDNRMRAVAHHLLISLSHAYRRVGNARWLAANQDTIAWHPHSPASAVRPWRKARAQRTPRQLEFDFDIRLPFPIPVISTAPE